MKTLAFTPLAIADIEGIWDYSAETWGPDQADRYTDEIRDACHAWEFAVDTIDDSRERLEITARVVAEHAGRPFLGFHRAAHAVVEAAILVTRVHLLGRGEVGRRIEDLRILVEKTGGPREAEAFALLAAAAAAAD
jgi:plasmid stabilization system protein ParE